MTDRPIIFSGPMVKALLAGRKSQTRRLAWRINRHGFGGDEPISADIEGAFSLRPTPWQRVKPGDRLYVREALRWDQGANDCIRYRADDAIMPETIIPDGYQITRTHMPGIFMPRWASRMTLTVTYVLKQRAQDIRPVDALDEGAHTIATDHDKKHLQLSVGKFATLWDSLHGRPGTTWDDNPDIVALTFTTKRANIDAIEPA